MLGPHPVLSKRKMNNPQNRPALKILVLITDVFSPDFIGSSMVLAWLSSKFEFLAATMLRYRLKKLGLLFPKKTI